MPDLFVRLPVLEVRHLGRPVAAMAVDPTTLVPSFEYLPGWLESGDDIAPLVLPRTAGVRTFPELRGTSFRGAPGLVADSLPGTFADLLTNAWLARHGIQRGEVSVLDRLAYVGSRGAGAITFHPAIADDERPPPSVVDLAEAADTARRAVAGDLRAGRAGDTLDHLLDTSGSAGGAHAKALIALGPDGEVRSGQHDAPPGFEHWLLKFDVAPGQRPGETTGAAQLEFAYHRMALDAGLVMTECRLLEVDGLVHFLTRRFDRVGPVGRRHVQSLAALAHLPPEHPGAHSYEQYLQTCLALDVSPADRRLAFRQVVFNLAAAVRDDHTKNLAFVHDEGRWRLAPAFDLTFPFLDGGGWLPAHQLTIAGSVHGAPAEVLYDLGERAKVADARTIVEEVLAAVRRWPDHARAAGVRSDQAELVRRELGRTPLAP